jgi:histidyl-tRNA synthetase
MNLSKQPYKGTRDYYPKDKLVQNYIFTTWRKVCESFGYEEYGAPLLEPLEIYAAKSGADLVNDETYTFVDRGDRKVAIRPEMTPSVARMIAARQQETPFPARWYSIANFMRYERPQNGREREFWQLNVDMFGVESLEADLEMLVISDRIMKTFGAKTNMYTIRINHRQLIDHMMEEYLRLDIVQAQLMTKLFDKKNKIPPEDFRGKAIDIFGPEKASEGLKKLTAIIGTKDISDLPKDIQNHSAFQNIQKLFDSLGEAGIQSAQFDISLMRGLDYYNGMVFEVFDNHPDNNRAMFGGGRYDGLTTLFGGDNIPVVGFAPGATTTELFLRSHNLLPEIRSKTNIYMIVIGEDSLSGAKKLADNLRQENLNVEVDMTLRKTEKQIKTALKKHIPYLLFVGEQELRDEQFTLKNVASQKEDTLSFERVVTAVSAQA